MNAKKLQLNRFVWIIASLILWLSIAKANAYQRLYGVESLSSSLITSICQDSCGYIWIGTMYGLNRFDGVYFAHYKGGGIEGLSKDNIECLLPDVDGNVWVVMYSKVQLYSAKENRFYDIEFKDCNKVSCRDILCTSDGEIWLMNSGEGIWRVDRKNMIAVPIESINNVIGKLQMTAMDLDSKGRLWIRTVHEALWCYDTNTGKVQNYFLGTNIANSISGIAEGSKGEIVIATHNSGIYIYDEHSNVWNKFCNAPNMTIMYVFSNNQGEILLGTDTHGLWSVDMEKKCVMPVFQKRIGNDVPRTNVCAYCKDKDGNSWVGFYKSGLFFSSNQKESFNYIDALRVDGDNGRSILTAFSLQNGNMLICQEGNGIAEVTPYGELRNRWLQGRGYTCVLPIDSTRMWVGAFSRGAGLLDMSTGKVEWLEAFRNGGYVKKIARDRAGNLYMAVSGRQLLSFTPDGKNLRLLCGGKMSLHNDWFNTIMTDSRGLLWVCHYYGFDIYDPENDRMLELEMDSALRSSVVYSIAESNDGLIWLGTTSGLFSYDFNRQAWKHYGKKEGLTNETVCGIVEDNDGDLWLATYNGLFNFDTKTEHFTAFYKGNGLKFDSYVCSVYGKSSSGTIYFGNDFGITCFNPDEVRISQFQRGIKLTGVFFLDRQIGGVDEDNDIRLSYINNTFTMRFSTMDFRETENVYYEYRFTNELDGVWYRTSVGVSDITLTNFSPGSYILQVRAHEGNVVSAVKQINIHITPPWWRSWWAYTFYGFGILAVIVLAFIAYIHEQKAKHNESEIMFLIDVGHELRSPLTLIKSPLDMLLKRDYDLQTNRALHNMKRNTERMLQLVNQMLSIRRIEKGQMKLHYAETNMSDFVENICNDYDYEAQKRGINLSFIAENEDIRLWIDRDNFDKVVNNLLTNAMKYVGDSGEIVVRLKSDSKKCILSVLDNGSGIDEQQLKNVFNRFYQISSRSVAGQIGYGIGLNLAYKLVKLHGGNIVARNRTDGMHGAEFIVTVPLGKSHLPSESIVDDNYFIGENFLRTVKDDDLVKGNEKKNSINHSTGYKVVVVDDDEEIRNFLQVELGEFYQVSVYSNGREALEAVTNDQPDLVVSDVMMPEMDGFTLLSRMKNNTRTSHVPVVLLTTKIEHQSRLEGLAYGADAYIDKPFDLEELLICIAGLIANRKRLKGKFSGMQEQDGNIKPLELKGNDALLMEKIMAVVNERLSDSELSVVALSDAVGLSRAQLHRRVKDITGLSVGEFIRNLRLQQAAKLLEKGDVTVSQVAYTVGMSNPNHFSIAFKKYFGVSPTEYMAKHHPVDTQED